MNQKKILMLGGLKYLIPVIKAAHELGYYVITCDYLPNNIAHTYSDEYHNVSITNKNAVLELAKRLKIDGIMSFAVDPGVLTAAYVAEELGLPGNPYKSVEILQNKDLFRNFLEKNNFTVPKSKGYSDINKALDDVDYFTWPVIVKPTDSAGSKGVTKVETKQELLAAITLALKNSISKRFIIEDFLEVDGFSSDSDSFSVNGELKCISFSSQRFDSKAANPYTPSAYSWPSIISIQHQKELENEIQRLLQLLNMKTSVYNIETRVAKNRKAYIMEVSPRGGGNRLSEILRYATGVDLIKNAVRASVGDEIVGVKPPIYNGCWAEIILHSETAGVFNSLKITDNMNKYVHEIDLWAKKGDNINAFNAANDAIGTLVMKFGTQQQLEEKMDCLHEWVKVELE
jgi:biotin carboxylase